MTKRRTVNSRIPEDDSIMEEMRLRCKRRGEVMVEAAKRGKPLARKDLE